MLKTQIFAIVLANIVLARGRLLVVTNIINSKLFAVWIVVWTGKSHT